MTQGIEVGSGIPVTIKLAPQALQRASVFISWILQKLKIPPVVIFFLFPSAAE